MELLFILIRVTIPLLIFTAVTVFLVACLPDAERRAARRRLGDVDAPPPPQSIVLRWLLPLALPVVPYTDLVRVSGYRARVHRKLIAGGLGDHLEVPEFIGLKTVLALGFLALALFWQREASLGTGVAALGVGFLFPDLWLHQVVRARGRALLRAFPTAVDMIALCVQAGLDFGQAIARVVQRAQPGPLTHELRLFLSEMRMGRTRADALRALADRVNLVDVSSFVTVLVQADQLGASISDTLRSQTAVMRAERFRKAEIAGGQAATKLLFPLVLFIFPTLFIILFGPIVIRFLAGALL